MDPLLFPVLLIVAGTLLVGALLSLVIGVVRRPDPQKYRQQWVKIAVLLAVTLPILVIGALGRWPIVFLGALLAYLGWREYLTNVESKAGDIPLLPGLIWLGCLGLTGTLWDSYPILLGGFVIAITLAWSLPLLITRRPVPLHAVTGVAFAMLYITLPLALLIEMAQNEYGAFAFLVLIAMANDGFAEGFGRLAGRTPLIPAVSPGKTREGVVGGIFTVMVMAFFARVLMPDWPLWMVFATAIGIALAGLLGDLIASSIKRNLGIKDFGRLIPEIGGTLDKFDSFYFAAPLFFILIMS